MKLKVITPQKILLEEEVISVKAEAINGYFALLPRHIDFVSILVPSILSYQTSEASEAFVAHDEGMLVKCNKEVLVSIKHAWLGQKLGELKSIIESKYRDIEEMEERTQKILDKIESNLVLKLLEIKR